MLKQGRDRELLAEHARSALATGKAIDRESPTDHVMLAEIYCDHYEELSAYALSILHSKERAEDAIQSAFTQTLGALDEGRRIDHVDRWLRRCVRNACVDELRLLQVECESEIDDLPGPGDPAEITDWRDRCRHVYRAAGDLPEHLRTAFLLSEVRGLTYQEIASEMERSVDSVRHLIFRARRHLREMLGSKVRGLALPALGFLGRERLAKGLVRRVHDLLFLKVHGVLTQLAAVVERHIRLDFSPALPLAVSVLFTGMVDGGPSGTADLHPAVDRSGPERTVAYRESGVSRSAGPIARHVSVEDSLPGQGEVWPSPQELSAQSWPVSANGGGARVGATEQAMDQPVGHGEVRGEPVAFETAGREEERSDGTESEDSPSGSGGGGSGASPALVPTSGSSPSDSNAMRPSLQVGMAVKQGLIDASSSGSYLSADPMDLPASRKNLPNSPEGQPGSPEVHPGSSEDHPESSKELPGSLKNLRGSLGDQPEDPDTGADVPAGAGIDSGSSTGSRP